MVTLPSLSPAASDWPPGLKATLLTALDETGGVTSLAFSPMAGYWPSAALTAR
jgi:hypothetical protein